MNSHRWVKIFKSPEKYWDEVATEPGDVRSLLPQMLILAAAPAIGQFVGQWVLHLSMASSLGVLGRTLSGAIITMLLSYGANLAVWLIMGWVINALAEPFGSRREIVVSHKLATGTMIPILLGGTVSIVPIDGIGLLGAVFGLGYGAYVLYLGLPILTDTAEEKAIGYSAATVGISLIIMLILTVVASCPATCLVASALLG